MLGLSPNGVINYWHDRIYMPSHDAINSSTIKATFGNVAIYAKAKYNQLGYYGVIRVCLILIRIGGMKLYIDQGPFGFELLGNARAHSCYVNRNLVLSDLDLDVEKTTESVINEVKRFFGIIAYDS